MSGYPELFMEMARVMPIRELKLLYSISKDFHTAINGHLSHTLLRAADTQAPESASIFLFTFYSDFCIPDPAARPHPNPSKQEKGEVRMVPSLCWLEMVIHREKTIRDILACMARQGHRMPKGISLSLKKMCLLMDIANSARRVQLMHSSFFTDLDLYHSQMFIVKLDKRFNYPIDEPGISALRNFFFGQRGLTPLLNLLKRTQFLKLIDIVQLVVRYDYKPNPEHRHYSIWGIPPFEIGIGHLEGWGQGRVHLMRPDELVIREAVRRRLDPKNHIMGMLLWGYVDPVT
jgi:hypothetical protein